MNTDARFQGLEDGLKLTVMQVRSQTDVINAQAVAIQTLQRELNRANEKIASLEGKRLNRDGSSKSLGERVDALETYTESAETEIKTLIAEDRRRISALEANDAPLREIAADRKRITALEEACVMAAGRITNGR